MGRSGRGAPFKTASWVSSILTTRFMSDYLQLPLRLLKDGIFISGKRMIEREGPERVKRHRLAPRERHVRMSV